MNSSLPATGRRARLTSLGWDNPLELEVVPAPLSPPEGDYVTVRVMACGVCHRDLIDRAGRIPYIQIPITPGHEAAGTVVATGPLVRDWKPGDRVGSMHRDACGQCEACARGETSLCIGAAHVLGIMADGGYADYLTLPQSALFALPASVDWHEAATLHCTFGTAYRDLVTLGHLHAGERVLIVGGNGGVGSAAIQIASRMGASEVIAVVRDPRHTSHLLALGATAVVVDPGRSFHDHPQVGRVDLVLDTVGAATFLTSLRALRLGGRCVVVGNIAAEKVALNLGFIIANGLTVIGGSGATRADMAALLHLHARRLFNLGIDSVLPLEQADEAQQRVRAGGRQGRVVLTMSPSPTA